MLFTINFALMTIIVLMLIFKTIRSKDLISIQLIVSIGIYLFLFINPIISESIYIYDDNYNFVITIGILGLILSTFTVPYNVLETDNRSKNLYQVKKKWLSMATAIFSAYLVIVILISIKNYGSIGAALTRSRLEAHLGNEYFSSNTSMIFIEFFKLLFYININRLFKENKKIRAIVLFSLPIIHHQFTANTRFDFIAMILVGLIFVLDEKQWRYLPSIQKTKNNKVSFIKKRLKTYQYVVLSLIIVPMSLLGMRILNNVRTGISESVFTGGLTLKKMLLGVLPSSESYYDFLYRLVSSRGTLYEYEYGLSWFIYPIINYIPRSLWSNKPVTSFSPRFTELLYWPLGQGLPVVTFTIFGEGFAQFGLLGVFLSPIIFIWSRYINIKWLRKLENSKIAILMIMISLLTYVRGSIPIFQSILYIIYLFVIINFMSYRIPNKGE